MAVAEEITSPELVLVSPPELAAQAREALPDYEVEFEQWVVQIRAAFEAEAAERQQRVEPEPEPEPVPAAVPEPARAEARLTPGALIFTAFAVATCLLPLVLLLVIR